MKKLRLAIAISLATSAIASQAAVYTSTATSGPIITSVAAGGVVSSTYYTNPTALGVSVSTAPAITLVRDGDWTFDFTDLNAVTFTGAINYGNYETQTNVSINSGATKIDGHVVYTGVTQSFSGTGVYNEATNTFTYTKVAGASNTGGGSVYSAGAPATCKNGATSPLGRVCTTWSQTTPEWEGLALNFVFSEDRGSFDGTIVGTEKGGSGLGANTTTVNWYVVSEIPIPAAAWLFGSALIGLTGIKRRYRK